MPENLSRSQLVAVDANVLFDLVIGTEDVVDAVSLIRQRIRNTRFVIPPTVQQELANWASQTDAPDKRAAAYQAIRFAHSAQIVPTDPITYSSNFANQVAKRVRDLGLIPETEIHDSLIIVECALLGCSLLLTSDEHLRAIDFERLAFELQRFDISPPLIATPREIVHKFFS